MAPSKRSAGAKGGAAKKSKKNPVVEQCHTVVGAIKEAEHLSADCRKALAAAVKSSLSVPVEGRQQFQVKVVEFLGEALVAIEKAKVAGLAETEAKVAGADTEKARREAAVEAAKASLAAKTAECDEKEKTHSEAVDAASTKKKELKDLERDLSHSEKATKKAQDEMNKYTDALSLGFAMLRDGTWGDLKEAKATLKKMDPLCKAMKLDSSLLTSLGSAVEKKPEARGTFDGVVITQLGDALQGKITEFTAELAKLGAECKEKSDARQAGLAAHEDAETAKSAAEEASTAAETERAALKKDLAEKTGSLSGFAKEQKEIAAERQEQSTDLEEFRSGALAAYAALKNYTDVPPPEPAVAPVAQPAA